MTAAEYNKRLSLVLISCIILVIDVLTLGAPTPIIVVVDFFIILVFQSYCDSLGELYLLYNGKISQGFKQARKLVERNLEVEEEE